jgi:hypothetical protein
MNMFNAPDIISTIKRKGLAICKELQGRAVLKGYLKTNQVEDGKWEDQD